MLNEEKKQLLTFLRKVKQWQRHRELLDKAVKTKAHCDVRKYQTEIQLDHMHIDADLDEMIKLWTWQQSKLDL